MNPQDQIRILQVELSRLRQEASALRTRLKENGRHPRRIERAVEDAILLAMMKVAGIHPSRRLALSMGLSQSRFEHALGLLRLARIVVRNRHWVTVDLAVIELRLQQAKDRAVKDKELFFLRHSRHHRRW